MAIREFPCMYLTEGDVQRPMRIDEILDVVEHMINHNLSIPKTFFRIDKISQNEYKILVPKRRIKDVMEVLKNIHTPFDELFFKVEEIEYEWKKSQKNLSVGKGQGSKFIERCEKFGWWRKLLSNEWFKHLQKSKENVAKN